MAGRRFLGTLQFLEPVRGVEPTSVCIGGEHFKLQIRTTVSSIVHQRPAYATPLEIGIYKDATDLVANESQEPDHLSVDLVHRRRGDREPVLCDSASLLLEEVIGEKRMDYERCPIPEVEELVEVAVAIGTERHPETIEVRWCDSPMTVTDPATQT